MASKSKYFPTDEEVAKTFKDHVPFYRAVSLDEAGKMEFLHWRKPGTGIYSIRYYCHWGSLMTSGDCGDAVWQFHRDADLEWIAKCDDIGYYLMSKLQASSHGRHGEVWNGDRAAERIKEFLKEREEKWTGEDPLRYTGSEFEWNMFLSDHGYELFGDPCEYGGIGMVTDYCLLLQLMGLQMAMKRVLTAGNAVVH